MAVKVITVLPSPGSKKSPAALWFKIKFVENV
jgi:hypothetical protein